MSARAFHVAVFIACAFLTAEAGETSRWWVFFRDKGPTLSSFRTMEAGRLTPRAIARRAKVMPSDRIVDASDLAVAEDYVRAITRLGARVRATSRWLNAVSVEASTELVAQLRTMPFIEDVRPVRTARRAHPPVESAPPLSLLRKSGITTTLDYGPSLTQNETANTIPLHNLGVIGKGVLVGMLDDGFNNHRVHPGLRSIDVVAEYDFIQRDSNVSVAPGEFASQGYHGASTLSVLAGFDDGELIGGAFGATLALGKTEIDSVEIQVEEDNYVEGLEWLEGLGVDIISTSLGYIDWYGYEDLDGQTAVTTIAAKTLASRGVLLVTAVGNEGQFQPGGSVTGTMIAPSDADSVLSVGAMQPNGTLASFSSTGPTFDGRIKPEIVAQGTSMRVAIGTAPSGYTYSQGTSFATPLTAAAAALIFSAHPEATPMQVRAALMATAHQKDDGTARTISYPNNYYGWGRIDAFAAALSLGPVVSNIPIVVLDNTAGQLSLVVNLRTASEQILDLNRFRLHARRSGETVYQQYPFVPGSENGLYRAIIPLSGSSDTLYEGYVEFASEGGATLRRPAGTALFGVYPTPDSIAQLFPPIADDVPQDYVLSPNYPNPFNAGTVIVYAAPRQEQITVTVYSLLGQKVRTLFSGEAQPGTNSIFWSPATDDRGVPLSSGVYVLQLTSPSGRYSRRLTLVK